MRSCRSNYLQRRMSPGCRLLPQGQGVSGSLPKMSSSGGCGFHSSCWSPQSANRPANSTLECAQAKPQLSRRCDSFAPSRERGESACSDVLAQQSAVNARQDAPLPAMVLEVNPPEGLVNLATYLWVNPATYGGQPYSEQATVPAPWTVDWDYWVTQTVSVACPAGALPGSRCTSTRQTLQHHHESTTSRARPSASRRVASATLS
jgi:hypothetical protein